MSGFRITTLWAFVSVDPSDGDEGLLAARIGDYWLPMVAADRERLELLRPYAEKTGRAGNVRVRLIRFEQRTEVEVLEP
jgi:alkanesulfonate monooxygenase SsuD/methylene tetrahydromethanopterin reductase-like flavin-dependent oxidoreductase (luciferase family)